MSVIHPSFSIVVSTYQRRAMVCETVQAIGTIGYEGEIELIVIIDGSDDGTREALEALAVPFPYRVIWQSNGGLSSARNAGAAAARHDIVLFLDDDMICDPGIVAAHARKHMAGADAVLGEIPLDGQSPPGFLTEGILTWAAESAEQARFTNITSPFQVFGGQMSVRRPLLEQLGGFDTEFTARGEYGQEDADFGVRLLRGHKVVHAPDAISYHRYIVTPAENMQRAFKSGRADVLFLRRHPSLMPQLKAYNRAGRRAVRFILRPLSHVPLLARLCAPLAVALANVGLKTRWRSSRHLARIYYAAQQLAYWSSVNRHGGYPERSKCLVLCYHAIADHRFDALLKDYSIPEDMFTAQVDALQKAGFTFVGPSDFLLFLKGVIGMPRRAVLLTFDDCYTDLLDAARKILRPRGIEALAFAVSGMKSGTNEWDQAFGATRLNLLDGDGLNALAEAGVEVGGHSRVHPMMPELPDDRLREETGGCADDLAALGLPRPRFFAYPFGGRDNRCISAVEQAGYAAGFGLADKYARPGRNLFDIPRVEMLGSDTPWRFWFKTRLPRPATILRTRLFVR